MKIEIKSDERLDDLHINGYKIIQSPNRFCFGIDAVLLSDFAKVKVNETAVDLGTGTGIVPILLEAKTNAKHIYGVDIQDSSVDMARRSVEYNNLGDKISIVKGDIKEFRLDREIEVVTCNPPYMANSGILNKVDEVSIARHEVLCDIEDVIQCANRLLKYGGRLYMVHRPSRLVDIMYYMRKYKLEPKVMRMVKPKINKEANIVLIEAVKGKSMGLIVKDELIVYNEDGSKTEEINRIYGY